MNLSKTGLAKVCPRCGRTGEVWFNTEHQDFEINWPPRLNAKVGTHRPDRARKDVGVPASELLDSNIGCGFDDWQPEDIARFPGVKVRTHEDIDDSRMTEVTS